MKEHTESNNTFFKFLRTEPSDTHREHEEEEINNDPVRNAFDHDRDRILFSKEFRRLVRKTQVFVSSYDDHIRNRLTHTLEVAQISKTICKNLGLNETLAEAIAYGHDVGHTPFGHIGERILNHLTNSCDLYLGFNNNEDNEKGFKHNWQSIKVVSTLEKINPQYEGLNLTYATIWGILHHSDLSYDSCKYISEKNLCNYQHEGKLCKQGKLSVGYYELFEPLIKDEDWSFEAFIVGLCDEIAQRHHDIEDGLMAEILGKNELSKNILTIFNHYLTDSQKYILDRIPDGTNLNCVIHDLSVILIDIYRDNLIQEFLLKTANLCDKFNIKNHQNFIDSKVDIFKAHKLDILTFSDEFSECDKKMKMFLKNRILNSHLAQSMDGKSSFILKQIIQSYITNPNQLPDATIITLFNKLGTFKDLIDNPLKTTKQIAGDLRTELSDLHFKKDNPIYKAKLIRTIVDFIAGMTDDFAMSQYRLLYGDKTINKFN